MLPLFCNNQNMKQKLCCMGKLALPPAKLRERCNPCCCCTWVSYFLSCFFFCWFSTFITVSLPCPHYSSSGWTEESEALWWTSNELHKGTRSYHCLQEKKSHVLLSALLPAHQGPGLCASCKRGQQHGRMHGSINSLFLWCHRVYWGSGIWG